MNITQAPNANAAWLWRLHGVNTRGELRVPRGKRTRDEACAVMTMDMRQPVVTWAPRKLSYQFMAAEAYWILSGSNRVDELAPWNKNIAQFSDDGETFFGAYGPKIMAQLPYVVGKLREDPSTRQACLTLWRENPPATKDYPCTIWMGFSVNRGQLDMTVFMRSSDAWMGIPYDVFSFSMVAHLICCQLNWANHTTDMAPGTLRLMMASSHLYEEHWDPATQLLTDVRENRVVEVPGNQTPAALFTDEAALMGTLKLLRDTHRGDPLRWWEAKDAPEQS